jgi:hypothetical protein
MTLLEQLIILIYYIIDLDIINSKMININVSTCLVYEAS